MARTNTAVAAGAATRERVLNAAVSVFGEKGFHGSSLDDIAQLSGIGRGTILYHFESKVGVLLELLARRDESVRIMQPDGKAPTRGSMQLLATIRRRSPGIRAAKSEMRLAHLLEAEAASAEHPAREWVSARAQRIRHFFADQFAEDFPRQDAASSTDAETLASLTLAVIEGLEAQWLVDPKAVDIDRALAAYESLIVRALR